MRTIFVQGKIADSRFRQRLLYVFIGISLAAYFFVGLRIYHLLRTGKIPYFSASMFEISVYGRQRYTLRIHRQGERVFDPPIYFMDAKEEMFDTPVGYSLAQYHRLIEAFGQALERQNAPLIERLRRQFEKTIVTFPLTYDVVLIAYDPRDFVRNRAVRSIRIVGEFTAIGI